MLYLFDFDGLLVDTERLHFEAYKKMCQNRGQTLSWNFARYCEEAHVSSEKLRDAIYQELPALQEFSWDDLYAEKKKLYTALIEKEGVALMPGAKKLLTLLQESSINHCVVTHSPLSHIGYIRSQHPILQTIPHWITREDYTKAKPDPECYNLAITRFAQADEEVIGFEDSPRGITALQGSRAHPIMICPDGYPLLPKGVEHYSSLEKFMQK